MILWNRSLVLELCGTLGNKHCVVYQRCGETSDVVRTECKLLMVQQIHVTFCFWSLAGRVGQIWSSTAACGVYF